MPAVPSLADPTVTPSENQKVKKTQLQAAAVAAVKKAVGIPRCSCQEVSNGRSDSTAALRLRVAR